MERVPIDRIITTGDVHDALDDVTEEINVNIAKYGRPYDKGYHSFSTQAFAVIPTLRKMIDSGRRRTVRGVYYCHPEYFYSSKSFAKFINILVEMMGLELCHVNIIPNVKGTLVASKGFKVTFEDGTESTFDASRRVKSSPAPEALPAFFKLPVDEENDGIEDELADDVQLASLDFDAKFKNGKTRPDCLLVFEKDDWLDELVRGGFFKQVNAIALCTKGYAQHNDYALVKMLHTKWPTMKIIAFNDAAPSGWDIMMKFYYMRSVGYRFSVPICMGGLLTTEITENDQTLNQMRYSGESMGSWDKTCLERIISHRWTKNSAQGLKAIHEMGEMTRHGKKYNKNHYKPPNGTLTEYMIDFLEKERYIMGPVVPGSD